MSRKTIMFVAVALAVLFCALPRPAGAKVVLPALTAHVADPDQLLAPNERAETERRLDQTRRENGFTIVVLVVATLDGEPIEDLAYRAFNNWGIGDRERDDGVLLVIANNELRTRIETGKGVGGALTDIESAAILRERVSGPLHAGELQKAVDAGTLAIEARLSADSSAPPGAEPPPEERGFPWQLLILVALGGLALFSPTARLALFSVLGSMAFGGGGGRGRGGFGGGGGGSSGGGGASGN